MRREDFRYELPEALIAQRPLAERGASRLLHLDCASGALADRRFAELPELLQAGDCVVVNDTRVLKARLLGHKASGGRAELLIERLLDDTRALAWIGASKPARAGTRIRLDGGAVVEVRERGADGLCTVALVDGGSLAEVMTRCGRVPLPPYIRRADEPEDEGRYQTVFARRPGAVAAPTAGLHFDEAMLERLRSQAIDIAAVTLHVGAGTFQPVRVADLDAHEMHAEHYEVSAEAVAACRAARARGRRVVAVGTTVLRALESAAAGGTLAAGAGETRLFIRPGYRFRAADALVTNFHLPESTLLVLVAACAGRERILAAYRHAVAEGYRFFSYGDAMLLTSLPAAAAGQ